MVVLLGQIWFITSWKLCILLVPVWNQFLTYFQGRKGESALFFTLFALGENERYILSALLSNMDIVLSGVNEFIVIRFKDNTHCFHNMKY